MKSGSADMKKSMDLSKSIDLIKHQIGKIKWKVIYRKNQEFGNGHVKLQGPSRYPRIV